MDRRVARNWMQRAVDGELSPEEARRLDGHLAGHPGDRQAAEELAQLPGLLGELPEADPPADLLPGVMGVLRQKARSAGRFPVVSRWVVAAGVAAAACLGGVALWLPNPPVEPAVGTIGPVRPARSSERGQGNGGDWRPERAADRPGWRSALTEPVVAAGLARNAFQRFLADPAARASLADPAVARWLADPDGIAVDPPAGIPAVESWRRLLADAACRQALAHPAGRPLLLDDEFQQAVTDPAFRQWLAQAGRPGSVADPVDTE